MKTNEEGCSTPTALPTEPQRPGDSRTPATTPWLHGIIRSVEATRELLLLGAPQDSTEEMIYWLPQTRFLYRGAEVKPNALHRGQQVSVQFACEAGRRFAKEIHIALEPPAIGSTTALRRSLWPSRSGKNGRK